MGRREIMMVLVVVVLVVVVLALGFQHDCYEVYSLRTNSDSQQMRT
jgi:uncharacterized membrane protein